MAKLGPLNELFQHFQPAMEEIARRTLKTGNEWGVGSANRLSDQGWRGLLTTSRSPTHIAGGDLDEIMRLGKTNEPFFNLHTHPGGGTPSPSLGDMEFWSKVNPSPNHHMGVVTADDPDLGGNSYAAWRGRTSSLSPLNYIKKWKGQAEKASNDPQLEAPLKTAGVNDLQFIWDLQHLVPMHHLGQMGVLDYGHSLKDMFSPDIDVNPDDAFQGTYDILKHHGYLDYARGGRA